MVLGLKRRAADVSPLVSATVKLGWRAHAHRSPESKPSAIRRKPPGRPRNNAQSPDGLRRAATTLGALGLRRFATVIRLFQRALLVAASTARGQDAEQFDSYDGRNQNGISIRGRSLGQTGP
jgi:hypothetical protein